MVKSLAKKTLETSVLLGLKEAYFFLRNLQGLFFHPYKTLRVMEREKNKLQVGLIFGLPFYFFVTGFLFIHFLRSLIQAPDHWGILAKLLFLCLTGFSLVAFLYLFYWLWVFFKLKKAGLGDKNA